MTSERRILTDAELLAALKQRCADAGLKCELIPESEIAIGDNLENTVATLEHLQIHIPEGRDFTPIVVIADDASIALKSRFEDFKRLRDFNGIWSHEHKSIECELTAGQTQTHTARYTLERLQDQSLGNGADEKPFRLPLTIPGEEVTISISTPSAEFMTLEQKTPPLFSDTITLQINNIQIQHHDHAHAILEKLSNSTLFSLDLQLNIALHPRHRPPREYEPTLSLKESLIHTNLPSRQFDSNAMNLYWYGRTSTDLPLLSFLAFYQVLEYYFPQYSHIDASRKIKNLLKDPTFNPEDDIHIARLLARIRSNPHSRSFGDEQNQLIATLQECINTEELRDFISKNEKQQAYYTSKDKPWRKLVDIPIRIDSDELLLDVARRIYRLRCRIVHTKHEDGEFELLLPFSREARALARDITLAEFLATRVLITSSTPLSLPAPR